MLNQVVLVGRLTKDPEVVNTESGKKVSYINLAVQRPFKNTDGIYETVCHHEVLIRPIDQLCLLLYQYASNMSTLTDRNTHPGLCLYFSIHRYQSSLG